MRVLRSRPPAARDPGAAGRTRPVVLATLGVEFAPEAVELAVDAAVEAGRPLLVVNAVELPPLAMSVTMGYERLEDPPKLDASLRTPAELAASLGVAVERLRVRSLRPVPALLELVVARDAGLLVFGPDPGRLRRWRFRRAVRTLREQAPCLVWTP